MNCNNAAGRCICSFSYGLDRIHIFEFPDENHGYMAGWLFCFNSTPYFFSVAGGKEMLDNFVAAAYAKYLYDTGDTDCLEQEADDECWKLDDDTLFSFHDTFSYAMLDAGFVVDEDTGSWN